MIEPLTAAFYKFTLYGLFGAMAIAVWDWSKDKSSKVLLRALMIAILSTLVLALTIIVTACAPNIGDALSGETIDCTVEFKMTDNPRRDRSELPAFYTGTGMWPKGDVFVKGRVRFSECKGAKPKTIFPQKAK